jgi:hypothetical protein
MLKQEQRLRKLWQETRDPACKTAVNWVKKSFIKITRRKALEQWGNKLRNCEVTPKAIWPPVKPLIKRDGPKTPTDIYGPLGLKYQPPEKATTMRIVWKISPHHMTRVTKP